MAIDATVNPLAYLEEAATKPEKQAGAFTPFFFAINDGEKALIRPLLNLVENNQVGLVEVYKHEQYDNATKTWKFRNVCAAKSLDGKECQCCIDAEALPEGNKDEKKMKRQATAGRRFILPVYLHAVVNISTGKQSTYTTQDGQELPVSGPRLLEMKPDSSPIFHDLLKSYQASESHDITRRDFKVQRKGTGIDTVYETTPMDVSPFDVADHDIPVEWLVKEDVFALYLDACPPKIVGEEVTPSNVASKGAVKSVPDF